MPNHGYAPYEASYTQTFAITSRRESAHFQQTRAAINALVAADFVAAREYATVFEEHRKVFEFICIWSFEQYTAKKRCGVLILPCVITCFLVSDAAMCCRNS